MSTYVYLTHKRILLKLGSVAMSLTPIVQFEEEEFTGSLGCLGTSFHKQSPHKQRAMLSDLQDGRKVCHSFTSQRELISRTHKELKNKQTNKPNQNNSNNRNKPQENKQLNLKNGLGCVTELDDLASQPLS